MEEEIKDLESRESLIRERIDRANEFEELEKQETRFGEEAKELQMKFDRLSELIGEVESIDSEKDRFPRGLVDVDREGLWELKATLRKERELEEKLTSFALIGSGMSFFLMVISILALIGGVLSAFFISHLFLILAAAGGAVFAMLLVLGGRRTKELRELKEELKRLGEERV